MKRHLTSCLIATLLMPHHHCSDVLVTVGLVNPPDHLFAGEDEVVGIPAIEILRGHSMGCSLASARAVLARLGLHHTSLGREPWPDEFFFPWSKTDRRRAQK